MKIVDVSAFYAPKGGGVRSYVERKLLAAPAAGHDLTVVAPGADTWTEARGPHARIRWLRSPCLIVDRNYRYFADGAALHRILDEESPDLVEASSPWRSADMVADWPGAARRSLVMHADPMAAYPYRWFGSMTSRAAIDRAFDPFWRHLRRLDNRFDLVISASQGLTARLYAGGLRKVVTNPLGIEPGLFSPTKRDANLRKRLLALCGLMPEATLLLGVGRHSPEKRWDLVVQAVTTASWYRPIGLLLVGDGNAREKLLRLVGSNPHIRMIAPIVNREALARLMASADALVHGCDAETFCFVAAEAAASGLPLIVPDCGGAADHLATATGWSFRTGDAADAARAIVEATEQIGKCEPAVHFVSTDRMISDHFTELFSTYKRLLPVLRIAA